VGKATVQIVYRVANVGKLCFIPAMASRLSDSDWSRNYEDGNTPWDKGYGAPPLKEYLDRQPFTGRVLVPGCGRGHDVRLLAGQGAEVVGQDISTLAIEMARAIEPVGNETYVTGDFLDSNADLGRFDLVFEHTCLCAIFPEERAAYVRAVHNALEPGGHLLSIFFVDIEDPEGPPFAISPDEIRALFGDSFETLESWVPSQAYPEREGREEMWLLRKR
jgi:SAM-dependent methyltransferase